MQTGDPTESGTLLIILGAFIGIYAARRAQQKTSFTELRSWAVLSGALAGSLLLDLINLAATLASGVDTATAVGLWIGHGLGGALFLGGPVALLAAFIRGRRLQTELRPAGPPIPTRESARDLRALLTPRNYLVLLATIVVIAFAYYLLISLPAHNRALLQLEATKRTADSAAAVQAQRRAGLDETFLSMCTNAAEDAYWTYIKLNGQPVPAKPGTYRAPMYIWDHAEKQKKAEVDECYRRYRR